MRRLYVWSCVVIIAKLGNMRIMLEIQPLLRVSEAKALMPDGMVQEACSEDS